MILLGVIARKKNFKTQSFLLSIIEFLLTGIEKVAKNVFHLQGFIPLKIVHGNP